MRSRSTENSWVLSNDISIPTIVPSQKGKSSLFERLSLKGSAKYNDILLLTSGSQLADSNIILMNEPGRYVYTNIKYKF